MDSKLHHPPYSLQIGHSFGRSHGRSNRSSLSMEKTFAKPSANADTGYSGSTLDSDLIKSFGDEYRCLGYGENKVD